LLTKKSYKLIIKQNLKMDRRKFIASSSAMSVLAGLAPAETNIPKIAKSKLKVLATNWGWERSYDEICKNIKKEGYDGLEVWWPADANNRKELFEALQKHQLEIAFLWGSSAKNPTENLAEFKKVINEACAGQSISKPLYFNSHSGKDYFTYEQNKAFIDLTTEITQKTGIPTYHETHRGRMLFASHIAKNFIEKNPSLRLTLDISHWCNVAESLLEDQAETIELALSRTDHIHTRIGHQEGPQVNDPRAPEWKTAFEAHLAWWDKVIERKVKEGKPMTILTEFGPPNYMPTLAYTQTTVANQWDINVFMLNFLKKRWVS
jgi:sugar phosphate isomerase/epimerase